MNNDRNLQPSQKQNLSVKTRYDFYFVFMILIKKLTVSRQKKHIFHQRKSQF